MKKIFTVLSIISIVLLLTNQNVFGQGAIVSTWPMATGSATIYNATVTGAGASTVTASNETGASPTISTNSHQKFYGYPATLSTDNTYHIDFPIIPDSSYILNINSISFNGYFDSKTAGFIAIYYTSDGGTTWSSQLLNQQLTENATTYYDSLLNINVTYGNNFKIVLFPYAAKTTVSFYLSNFVINGTTYLGLAPTLDPATTGPTIIDSTSASGAGGTITNIGSSGVTVSGVCWSSVNNPPTIADYISTDGPTTATSWTNSILSNNGSILTAGTTYYVRAYATNSYGTGYAASTQTFTTLGPLNLVNNATKNIPATFGLEQNYPNPFNPSTTISYEIPVSSKVVLKVYDILGNEVATLVNENMEAGRYNIVFDASRYSSGVYFYRLIAGSNSIQTKKMILLR